MPIYEYKCSSCSEIFERLELSIREIPTSQCPMCGGAGTRLISAPSIVYEVFNERATHRLPDWNQKMAQAKAHDARTLRGLKEPLERDKGSGIKEYNMEFGRSERDKLVSKAQLDNMG